MRRFAHVNNNQPRRFDQQGSGIVDTLRSVAKGVDSAVFGKVGTQLRNLIPASDETAANQFPGERHQILKLGNSKLGSANFSGPGTQVVKRVKRGDKPRTLVDKVAYAHDLRYTLSDDPAEIRLADKKMIDKLNELQKEKKDKPFNIKPAKAIIRGKMAGEDLKLFKKDTFVDFGEKLEDEDRKLLQGKLDELEQEGYGKRPGQELKKRLMKAMHHGSGHCGAGVTLPGQSGGAMVKRAHKFYTDLHRELMGAGLKLPGMKGGGVIDKQLATALNKAKSLKPKARHAAKVIAKNLSLPVETVVPLMLGQLHKKMKGGQLGAGSMKRIAKKIAKAVGPFLKEYGPTIASTALALL